MSKPSFEIEFSRQFSSWLFEQQVSLCLTTYQAGKLFFIGLNPTTGQISIFERSLERVMGLYATGSTLYTSTLYQLWRFENSLAPEQLYSGYDRLYVPQLSYVTGDLDIHDIVTAPLPQSDANAPVHPHPIFINTLFSCIATTSITHSFLPLWQPQFISRLAAEDRCHLNGLALRDGRLATATAVSRSDVAAGWRDRRRDGGCAIDIASHEIIASGLSMPHSPRWYRDRLWLFNSGTGEFGYLDGDRGQFQPVAFCPGYLRGLAFHGDFALVGLSKPRHNKALTGLELDDRLQAKDAEPKCGVNIIDLRTGDIVHHLRFTGIVEELYDVAVLPGVRRPMAIGFRNDEIRRVISIEEPPTS